MHDIVIVDYGMGNLRSVQKAFERQGAGADITSDPDRIATARKLVLPGVGAFADAIAKLRTSGLDAPILDHIRAGRPFLGICLGLQLLFTRSFEDGEHAGLNVLGGDVVRFSDQPGRKIPHMGWNQLLIRRPSRLLAGLPDRVEVYFVHSYYAVPQDASIVAAETEYPTPFTAVIERDNLFATQFHPEKSQAAGLHMLGRFLRL